MNKISSIGIILACMMLIIYHLFTQTNIFIPSQKELRFSDESIQRLIQYVSQQINTNDTILLITQTPYGAIGNEARFDVRPSLDKSIKKFSYHLSHPYTIPNNLFYHKYELGQNTIIAGTQISNWFYSYEMEVNLDSVTSKSIYQIQLDPISEHQIRVIYKNLGPTYHKDTINMMVQNGEWQIPV